jgi:hypothetical protein
MDKLDKIAKIVETEVDEMSMDKLRSIVKWIYQENYYQYTDWQINELYNQMFTNES